MGPKGGRAGAPRRTLTKAPPEAAKREKRPMFGYVKAYKPELKLREFERYRAVYCALCKAIGAAYGQVPRLAVSYDLTFLLLLLQALGEEAPEMRAETCLLHPFKPHPIGQSTRLLEAGAALAVLLAEAKLADNRADGDRRLATGGLGLLTRGAVRKAGADWPELARTLAEGLGRVAAAEEARLGPEPQAGAFGALLAALTERLGEAAGLEAALGRAAGCLLRELGVWVYLVDALDDFAEDVKKRGASYIEAATPTEAWALLEPRLVELEEGMAKTAAVLPYARDAGIVANVVLDGLREERLRLMRGLARD